MSIAIDYSSGAFAANKAQGVGTVTAGTGTYNLAVASYDSVSFSVASQETDGHDIFFKPDGTKLYMVGTGGDDVNEYSLSTAWDLSTASYVQSFSVSTQETGPSGIFFKDDGTKMYITGGVGDDVNEYNLSTAWDISTASYLQNFSVSAQISLPRAIFFKGDGTKMFIADQSGSDINEYGLSTAWDVSSASFTQTFSVSSQSTSPQAVYFNPYGTEMFVGDIAADVYKYSLSTGWDLSTASYDSITFDVSSQNTNLLGLFFKSDGSKMYTMDSGTDAIYQYTTGSTATFSYPSSVEWPSGTAPDAPASGETDVLVFLTDDGGTSYQGFQAGDAMS